MGPTRRRPQGVLEAARAILGPALTVALVRAGFAYGDDLGEPVWCARGDHHFTPLTDVPLIGEGNMRPQSLDRRLAAAGIADVPLAAPPEDAGPGAGPRAACRRRA